MPSLLEILNDPNYIDANEPTKQAIFDKYSALDKNYTGANPETQSAIRQRFGVGGGGGFGQTAADLGKLTAAGAITSVAGAPEAIQSAGSGAARETAFLPTDALNLLASPTELTNKITSALSVPSITNKITDAFGIPKPFKESQATPLVPEFVVKKQQAELDKALTQGKIQSLRKVTELGSQAGKAIEESISPEMKKAMAASQPTGNLVKALDTGDFSEISMGSDPSLLGLSGQIAKVFGSTAPVILTSLATKSVAPGAAVGFGQAAAEGVDTARQHIKDMSYKDLAMNSEYFRNLMLLGYDEKTARQLTEERAADTAALYQGSVGALGGAFTGSLVTGKFDKLLLASARNRATRVAAGTAAGMTEEGLQELAEGLATDLGINKTVVKEVGTDSFANLVLGALGGGAPGAVRGAIAKPEVTPGTPEATVAPEATAVATEATTVAPQATEELPPTAALTSQDREAMLAEVMGQAAPPEAVPATVAPAVTPQAAEAATVTAQVPEAAPVNATPKDEQAAPFKPIKVKPIAPDEFNQRIAAPEIQASLKRYANEAGWAEIGGKMIRSVADDYSAPVVGRTKWIPNADWWLDRPVNLKGDINGGATRNAINKALAGEKLKPNERKMVDYLIKQHDFEMTEGDRQRAEIEQRDREVAEFNKQFEAPQTQEEAAATQAEQGARIKAQEDAAIQADMDAQAERDRAEIARRSAEQAQNFGLGQTPEESLTGQQRLDDDIPFFSPEMTARTKAQQLADSNEMIRDEKIAELQAIKQRKAAVERRFIKGKSKKFDMQDFKTLATQAKSLSEDIKDLYEPNLSPEAFLAKAAKEQANGEIDPAVYQVIDKLFKKNPALLEGLRLSVKQGKQASDLAKTTTAGEFLQYERIVRLYKGTSGTEDPKVVRHELTHSLEQMMPKEARRALYNKWYQDLQKAEKSEKTEEGKTFFENVNTFLRNPGEESMRKAIDSMPNYDYYQYISPSEYWAVNAEPLMDSYLGGAWQKFKTAVRRMFEAIKDVLGFDSKNPIHKAFAQAINGKRMSNTMINDYIGSRVNAYAVEPTKRKNYLGEQAPLAQWDMPDNTKMESFLYKIQDKYIDTKRAVQAIKAQVGEIADQWDAYLKEELYHGRTAKKVKDFLNDELLPIVQSMQKNNITLNEFDDYLHNRHAEERNIQIAKINPELPDSGSGIATQDAKDYMAKLLPATAKALEAMADKIDKMIQKTQKILVNAGLESQDTIDIWNKTYKHYVPLMREDLDFSQKFGGTGAGFSTKGGSGKRAVGSLKEVADIFANIAAQRERAIVRSEKARVGKALYGLAILNPNPGFWLPVNPDAIKDQNALIKELKAMGIDAEDAKSIIQEPKTPYIDENTGLVAYRVNPLLRNSDNVFPVRIDGKDRFIFFNPNDERAMRMVSAIKNLDSEGLGLILGTAAKFTRWIASVNTQYNPVFGAYNFIRDVGGAQFNLTTTPIAGKQAAVTAGVFPALKGIYKDLRSERAGEGAAKGEWSELWEEFQREGGATGYRDQFSKSKEELNIIEKNIRELEKGNIKKGVQAVFNWLSDYNDALENAVRLSAYKVALDQGLSKERAASIAKNLTVNFNRKGAWGQQAGSLYAFFNASVQGSTRLYETLTGPQGKKIIAGGLLLGSVQALALAMAGFEDDEPPEFVKERNLVIPLPGGTYFAIPMPLGLHVIPNAGRIATEMVLTGGKGSAKKIANMTGVLLDSFNPVGNAGLSMQTVAPTLLDPIAAIFENRDSFGRPIAKEDRATNPSPGYTRSRDTASAISKGISEFLNYASGGTKYQKGLVSPTADQLDFLIGQATGGVGREVMKTEQAITSLVTGEELPSYKVPLVGRFYGDIGSQAAQSNKFYDNITNMANHEAEIKGRKKNGEDVSGYLEDNPEARLWSQANALENEISKLNREKKDLISRNAPKERIKRIEEKKTQIMTRFNQRVRNLEEQ